MAMQILTMQKVLEYIQTQGLENVNLKVEWDGETLYTTAQIFNEFAFNYSTYKIPLCTIFPNTAGYFVQLWQEYVRNTVYNLYRTLDAMAKEYDPIANYDMTESGADGKRLSKETAKTTPKGGTETETNVNRYGVDSGTYGQPFDKSTVTVKPLANTETETTREYNNDQGISFDGTSYSGYHEGNEHFLKRSGNVGVTTNAQLLTGEIEVRKHDILREYVKTFIDRYAYCVGGVDE